MSLFGQASKALGWSLLNTLLGRFGTLAIGIVLARVLGPREFGTFAVAMVALLAVLSFNELGVSLAIVRWPGEPAEIAPTVATISLASSALIYAGCFAGAPFFAAAMGAPAATSVIRVLSLSVLLDGLVAVPAALLQRTFRQDRKLIADQVNSLGGAAVSIALALSGWGAMSLAAGRLAGAAGAAVLFVVFSPAPLRFGFDRTVARRLLRFGLPLAGSSVIVFAVAGVDQLVVGNVLGATALGFYVLAVNLSNWPIGVFSQPVRSVAPAAFARLQHDVPAMRRTFLSTAGLLTAVTLPVCVLLGSAAGPLVHFVYGSRWQPAASALLWLALLAGLRILFELVYDYFVVLARTRAVLAIQLFWLLALVPALIVGAHLHGIAGVAVAHAIVAGAVTLPFYLLLLHRSGIGVRAVLACVGPALLGACAAASITVLIRHFAGLDLLVLTSSGLATVLVIGLLAYRMRDTLRALRGVEHA